MDERLRRAPVGVLELTVEGTVTAANARARELVDADGDPTGQSVETVVPRSVDDSLVAAFEGDGVAETEFEEYYPSAERWLAVSVVSTGDGVAAYLRDVTAARRRKQTLERLRAERSRTEIVDEVLSDVLAELVETSTREEIAETIADGLGGAAPYEFAWIGEREVGGDGLAVRASAGATGETFAAVREALEGGATTPEERAIDTGDLQVVQPLAEDGQVPESVRMAGFADGVQSALAIPLAYGSTVHGVVGIYASGTDAPSERERSSFETLGEVAGFAVTAARNRSLLLSDRVTEVTFDVGEDSVPAALSVELGTELELEGLVARGDESLLCYLDTGGEADEGVVDVAAGSAGVGDVRTVGEDGSDGTIEVEVREPAPLLDVSSLGGTVRRASFEGGSGRVVVDLPPDGDARRIVGAVTRNYDAELVAKRERNRSVTTAREFRDELAARLTERQETALRAAYLGDYFESPRGSTAEEVAASLDITGSTLLYHLRASQRKLLDAFFEDDGTPAE